MDTIVSEKKVEKTKLIRGKVVTGRQKGRELGFPTANIQCENKGIKNGVYGVCVWAKGLIYTGVMNIGVKPTFNQGLERTVEVHLLDFEGNLYGHILECQLVFKIREEQKFVSIEALKQQIKEDERYARDRFSKMG
ncbi:riboflavin kinase [Priestia megaterium]|uniref:riboflavin kinase n=1 Tax=Priestia megaterium TaxID=1404 RepID=UPI002E1F40A7|nr:riboflavin kinase [Priestia megaterium]